MRKLLIATGILALFTGCEVSFKTLTLEDNLPVPKPIVGLGDFHRDHHLQEGNTERCVGERI